MAEHHANPATAGPAPIAPRPTLGERLAGFFAPSHLAWAIPGPVFHKEMWMIGRRGGTYWVRGLYVLGLTALVSLVFLVFRMEESGSASQRIQSLQNLAPRVLLTVVWFQFVALAFASIILASPMVCDEKRKGTLGTLLVTPLKSWQIVVGKLAALFVQLSILALASAPLLLAIRLFGGVTAEMVIGSTALCITSAGVAASLGLFHSIDARRAPTAAGAALFTFLFSQFGVPLLTWFVSIVAPKFVPTGVGADFYAIACPPIALGLVSTQSFAGLFANTTYIWVGACLWNLALVGVISFGAAARLRVVMRREGSAGAPIPKPKKSAPPTFSPAPPALPGSPAGETAPRARRPGVAHASREVGDQPVLWREVRHPMFRSRVLFWLLTCAVAGLLLFIYFQVAVDGSIYSGTPYSLDLDELAGEGLNFPITIIGAIVAFLLAMFGTGALIAGEKESRTWDVLLTTPLSAWDIIWGKYVGALRRQWYAPAVVGAHLLVVCALGGVNPIVILHLALVIGGAVAAVTATGVWFSLAIGKATRAAAANFGVWFALWAVLPMLTAMVGLPLALGGRNFEDVMALVSTPNAVGWVAITGTGAYGSPRDPDPYDYYGWFRVSAFVYTLMTFAFFGAHALGAYLVLRSAAGILARRSGRRA